MASKILKTVHECAQGLTDIGVMDKQTMREFDALCLPPVKVFTQKQIRNIRKREMVSQTVFAKYLNIKSSTIQSWEQGDKKPSGAALKLLNLVEKKGLAYLGAD